MSPAHCRKAQSHTRRRGTRIFGRQPLNLPNQGHKTIITQLSSNIPLYSRKLHIRVRRARTSWVTSFTIFAFTFGAIVVNHFASRTFPRARLSPKVSSSESFRADLGEKRGGCSWSLQIFQYCEVQTLTLHCTATELVGHNRIPAPCLPNPNIFLLFLLTSNHAARSPIKDWYTSNEYCHCIDTDSGSWQIVASTLQEQTL